MFDDDLAFVTCPNCRRPLPEDGGGCHFWSGASQDDRRVTRFNKADWNARERFR